MQWRVTENRPEETMFELELKDASELMWERCGVSRAFSAKGLAGDATHPAAVC